MADCDQAPAFCRVLVAGQGRSARFFPGRAVLKLAGGETLKLMAA
jgi:hypothetical protein